MSDLAIDAQSLLFALFSTSGLIVDRANEDEIEIADRKVIDNVLLQEQRRMRVLSRQIYDCSADLYVVFGLNSSETLKELLRELNVDEQEYKAFFYQVTDSDTFATISIIGVVESSWSLVHISNSFLVLHVNADDHDIEMCILPPTQVNTTNNSGRNTRDIVANQSAEFASHFSRNTPILVPTATSSVASNGVSTSIVVRAVHSPVFPTRIPVSIPNVQWLTPQPVPVPASGGFTLPTYVKGGGKDLGFVSQVSDSEGDMCDDIHDGYHACPAAWTWRGRSPSIQQTPAPASPPPPEPVPSEVDAAHVPHNPLATCAWVGLLHHQARALVTDVAQESLHPLTSARVCGLWVLQPDPRVPCASSGIVGDDNVNCAPFSLRNVHSLSPHVPLLWEAGPCPPHDMREAEGVAPAPQLLVAAQPSRVAPPADMTLASSCRSPAHTPPPSSASPTHASSPRAPPSVSPPAPAATTLPAPTNGTSAATTPRPTNTVARTAVSPPWVSTSASTAANSPSSLASAALSRATHPSADTPPSRSERLSRQQRRGITEEDVVINEVLRAVQTGAQLPRRAPPRQASPQHLAFPTALPKRKASRSPERANSPPARVSRAIPTTSDTRARAASLVSPTSAHPAASVSALAAPLVSTRTAQSAPSSSSPPSPSSPARPTQLASTDPLHAHSERPVMAAQSPAGPSGVGEGERDGSGTVRPVPSSAGLAARPAREAVDVARLPVAGQLVRTLKSDTRGEVRRRQGAPSVPAHVARVLEEPLAPLQCRECGAALDAKDPAALKAHWTREHNYFVCGEREYAEGYTLEDTGGDGQQVAILRFTLCQSRYRNASDASTHRSEHKFVFKCSLCEGSFTTEKSLKTHLQKHCAMLKGVACPTCRAFTGHSAAQLRNHLLSTHALSAAATQEQLLRLLGRTDASTTTHLRASGAVVSPARDARRRSRAQQVQRPTHNDDEDSNVQTNWPWLHNDQMNG